jgi:hypothetical protein
MKVRSLFFLSSSSPKGDSGIGAAFPLRAARGSLAALLLAVPLTAAVAPYAPEEHDFSELSTLEPSAFGIVESVREVPLHADPAGLAGVLEHSLNAETGVELVLRLDDGRVVTVRQDSLQPLQPGERVRLLAGRALRT